MLCRYELALATSRIIKELEDAETKAKAEPAHKLLSVALALEYETELRDIFKPMKGIEDTSKWLEFGEECLGLVEEALEELRHRAGVPVTDEERSVTRGKGKGRFRDVPYPHWSYEVIDELKAYGLVEGYPDGVFHGRNVFTRYEMAMVVARVVDKLVLIDDLKGINLTTKVLVLAMVAEYQLELQDMEAYPFQLGHDETWIVLTAIDLRTHFHEQSAGMLTGREGCTQ